LRVREFLAEALIEDRDQLEAEDAPRARVLKVIE